MATEHYDNAKSDATYANTLMADVAPTDIPIEMIVMLLGSIATRLGAIADALTEGKTDE